MQLRTNAFFKRVKAARSAFFVVTISFSLTMLLAIPAMNVQHGLQLKVDSRINEQEVNVEASIKLLNRDIEDLEDQLRNGLKRQEPLIGSFEIYPGARGLTATHTSAPNSPIEIVADRHNAFSDSLSPQLGPSTYIFTNDGAQVSKIRGATQDAATSYNLSAFVKSMASKAKKTSGFVKMGLGGVTRQQTQPSILSLLRERDNYYYSVSPLKNTNLVLITVKNISLNRREVGTAFAPLAIALLGLLAGSALAYRYWRDRRKSALEWLQTNLKGFRYGRFELSNTPAGLTGWDRALIYALKEQFGTQSPFSPFYTGKWLDERRRIATWQAFRDSIALWSMHKKAGNDVVLGDHWIIGRVKASRAQTLESAIRILGRSFSDRAIFFNHYGENEFLFAARAQHFEEWFDRTQKALRAWVDYENLRASDFSFTGCLFSAERRYTVDQVFEKFEAVTAKSLKTGTEVQLQDAVAHFWDHSDETEAVLKFSWLQLMILPVDRVRHLTQFERVVASMPQPGSPEFPAPVYGQSQRPAPMNFVKNQQVQSRPVPPPLRKQATPTQRPTSMFTKKRPITGAEKEGRK